MTTALETSKSTSEQGADLAGKFGVLHRRVGDDVPQIGPTEIYEATRSRTISSDSAIMAIIV